ncbi:ankyrin repeat-containing domain protein [Aspergillus spectabilis]
MRRCFQDTRNSIRPILDTLPATDIPVHARNYQGETLLHCAFSAPQPEDNLPHSAYGPLNTFSETDIVSMLGAADSQGRLPIHHAAMREESLVEWLNSKGANPSVGAYDGQSPLHLAASAKQSNAVGLLLESCEDTVTWEAVNQPDGRGRTALHCTARSGRPESEMLLLEAGADVNIADKYGYTPLHLCAEFGRNRDCVVNSDPEFRISSNSEALRVSDIIQLLRDRGADIGVHNYRGKTAADLAIENRNDEILDLLSLLVESFKADVNLGQYKSAGKHVSMPLLHILSDRKHWWQTGAIQYLLDHGADANLPDDRGQAPLHISVKGEYRRLGIFKLLREHGADPNAVDRDGMAPLSFSIGDPEIVQVLIQLGADITAGKVPALFTAIDKPDPDTGDAGTVSFALTSSLRKLHYGPLQVAAMPTTGSDDVREKIAKIVQLLLDHGADPFLPIDGDTTIMHSLLSGDAIVEPLLALPNFCLERRDQCGRTLLLAACNEDKHSYRPMRSRLEIVRTLCDRGADASAVTNNGDTAASLLLAVASPGRYPVAKVDGTIHFLLQKCPSLLHCANARGDKLVHLAAQKKRWSLVAHYYYTAHLNSEEGLEIVKSGRALGLDINAQDNDGNAPVSKYILESETPMHGETEECKIGILRDAGANIFTTNIHEEGLLHLVARAEAKGWDAMMSRSTRTGEGQRAELFKYLMGLGLDPMVEDLEQRTAVDVAAAHGKTLPWSYFRRAESARTSGCRQRYEMKPA